MVGDGEGQKSKLSVLLSPFCCGEMREELV